MVPSTSTLQQSINMEYDLVDSPTVIDSLPPLLRSPEPKPQTPQQFLGLGSGDMSYIPPHKRHSKAADKPSPVPDSLAPRFHQALTLSPRRRNHRRDSVNQASKIFYAAHSVSRWWPAGPFTAGGADPIPDSFRLEEFSGETVDRKTGAKPMVLVGRGDLAVGGVEERPWVSIAERVVPDLVDAARSVLNGLESEGEEIKLAPLALVARVGKILFHGSSVGIDTIKKAAAAEGDSRSQVHKSFYTDVPETYMEGIQNMVVPKIGFDFDSEKEHYRVKVFDKCWPDSIISCKCTVGKDGRLEIYKIELNPVRHLVADISCLYKDLDLRLMLLTKRMMINLDVEQSDGINKLISFAMIDPDVKGGLRWPLGRESVEERFSIVGVFHTKYKAFKSSAMKLKLRNADRFDHRTSSGEVSSEVPIKLIGISKQLREGNLELGPLREMVQDAVELVWKNFLSYIHSTT